MQSIRQYKENDLDAVFLFWEDAVTIAYPFLKQGFLDTECYSIPKVYCRIWILGGRSRWEGWRIYSVNGN